MEAIFRAIAAATPAILGIVVAAGVHMSPEVQALVTDNVGKVMTALGLLAGCFPSFKAVWKWRKHAD